MAVFLQEIFIPMMLTECFVGVAVNVFIVAVQIMKWKSMKSLDSCDQILLCLGLSKSLVLTNIFCEYLSRTYLLGVFKSQIVFTASSVAATLLYFTNFWFLAVLCVFYCVKIATYNNPIFIFLKTRISRLVPWFIGASLLISAALSIPCSWFIVLSIWQNSASTFQGNITLSDAVRVPILKAQFMVFILGCCVPFFICCGSVCLLIHSLWRHTKLMMRCSRTGSGNPNVEAHVAAVKNMSVFLFFQAIDFGCCLISVFTFMHLNGFWKLFFVIIVCAAVSLNSAHIIYSNANLNKAFRGMWLGILRSWSI
ncbi:taste receptor type 2 member 39-like [Hyperolius riggenbachi]|uniref:taste receptor type 2 member 39-like n=1 Tax=Hyperolius riggenbachi TaxID=752182 RepID=UPI0035A26B04